MKRKRFKHQADILSRMFCGWQLHSDFNAIAKLGNGTLYITTLDGECKFNDTPIKQLSIAKTLNSWLMDDLSQNHISPKDLDEALLTVSIAVEPPKYGDRFTEFNFDCTSHIVSGTDTYTRNFKDKQSFECKKAIKTI